MSELTFEQKRKVINNFCKTNDTCYDCILYQTKEPCGRSDVIDRNYKILVDKGLIKEPTPTESNKVDHPSHYTHGMECIDEMILVFGKEAVKHFCLCNAWKYRKRAIHKNGEEDMNKSDWYLNKYKELNEVNEVNDVS